MVIKTNTMPRQRQRQTQERGRNNNTSDYDYREYSSFFDGLCICCDEQGSPSCRTSIIFLGFVAFYLLSFLWDIFVIVGGFQALSISELHACIDRAEYFSISPVLVLVLLFVACFHAIALVWIIGFVHSKPIVNCRWYDCCFGRECVDVPTEFCSWTICIPFLCFDMLMIIQFGLSLYVYLFLEQLIEEEPDEFVDRFCIGYDQVEEAYMWMLLSIIFFILTILTGCLYCCLIRIATNDISILQPGQQQFMSPQVTSQQSPRNNNLQHRPLNAQSGDENY